jgi:DNA-binding YbaB/EbfC family protein
MKGIPNLQKMMKSAKEMQDKLQRELAEMRIEGSSGGGMITIVVDGSKSLMDLKIDPEVVDKNEVDMLQDLIMAAFNDASAKADEAMKGKLGAMGAGLNIPGLF